MIEFVRRLKMPFKTYSQWLFDGDRRSPFPKATDTLDILKYNSPITVTYAISMFMKHGKLNWFLNKYFNNMNLRYIDKQELFEFMKKCIFDFRVTRRDIVYFPFKRHEKLFKALREKHPELKNNDITLLCKIIEKSKDRDVIYQTLDLEKPKKRKVVKKGKIKQEKISYKELMDRHFSTIKL
jgi:hypothetical protein